MTRFHLAALPLVLAASTAAAEIIVEARPLSGPSARAPAVAGRAPAVAAVETSAAAAAPAATPAAPAEAANPLWQQYTQVEQLQQQIQQLQGLVEQQGFLLEKLQNDLRLRYTDLDQRMAGLQDQLQQQQQAAAGSAVAAGPAAAPASPTLEEEKRAYLAAYETFRVGGPDKAIPPMLAFVKRYPNSSFVPGAYYWLGEFYLNASVPDQAAAQRQFDVVLLNYPDTPKAPAALYKSGAILDLQGKPQEARKRMQELLQKYPQSAEASLAQSYIDALDSATKAAAAGRKPEPGKPPAGKPAAGKVEARAPAKPAAETSSRKKN